MPYIYRHIRHDKNEPFYIGIGSDKTYKRAKAKASRNEIWKKIVSKTSFSVEILFDDISIEEAMKKEIEFISMYGRIANNDGILANLSGGGASYNNHSLLTKKKISNATKGEKNPFYGKKHSIEARVIMSYKSKNAKRLPTSNQTKEKIRNAMVGRVSPTKGTIQQNAAKKRMGVNHHSYKGKINCYDLNMNFINTFDCARDIVESFNLNNVNNIRRVLIGERKFHKGMIFKYKIKE